MSSICDSEATSASGASLQNDSSPMQLTGEQMLERVSRLIHSERAGQYEALGHFRTGGTRTLFSAGWGPRKDLRVVKVDSTPKNGRAKRHVERGCTTANELASIAGIHHQGITQVIDYFMPEVTEKYGLKGVVLIEEAFDGCHTLDEIVKSSAPLADHEATSIFSQAVATMDEIIGTYHMYHRDLNPTNILVLRRKGNTPLVKITDWTNAGQKEKCLEKILPTAGGHRVTAPWLITPLTGKESRYDDRAEIYALASDFAYAALGGFVLYDSETCTARSVLTDETLLDSSGKLDPAKHEAAIEAGLEMLSSRSSRYKRLAPVLRKALSVNPKLQYASFAEFARDVADATAPTLWERWRRTLGVAALAAVSLTAPLGIVSYHQHSADVAAKQQLSTQLHEAQRHQILSTVTDHLDVVNNTVDLDVSVRIEGTRYEFVYGPDIKSRAIAATPGETLQVHPNIRARPRKTDPDFRTDSLVGKAYIEGLPATYVKVFAIPPEGIPSGDGWMMSGWWQEAKVQLPKDMLPGVYTLATEVYASFPQEKDKQKDTPCIARKRIPVYIGNPKGIPHLDKLTLAWQSYVSMGLPFNAMDDIDRKLQAQFTMLRAGLDKKVTEHNTTNAISSSLQMPLRKAPDKDTFCAVLSLEGELKGFSCVPVATENIADEYFVWMPAVPRDGFSEELVAKRNELLRKYPAKKR